MSSTHPASLGDYQDQVEGMIDAGGPFGVVEDTINAAALVEDQKAAVEVDKPRRAAATGLRSRSSC